MSRTANRLICLTLAAVMLALSVPCDAAPAPSASAYVLLDADSGRVLLSQRETDELPIASTTKIMTALTALGMSRLTDAVTVKREHLKEGSSMYLAEGETLTMEELLYGLMLPSGNDAAECIADYCGGDGGTAAFVRRMNETAAALGMTHTSFANPSGLDAEGHYSCALDMARLMARAMDDPTFAQIVSTRTVKAGVRAMKNHNKLLGAVEGCIGGKTGYTGSAGRTLVTCAEREGLRLVAVTLHDGSDWDDHRALYDYGFSRYRAEAAVKRGAAYAMTTVQNGAVSAVPLVAAEPFSCAVAEDEELTLRVDAPETATAPIAVGEPLGTLRVLLDGAELGSVPLIAAHAIPAAEPSDVKNSLSERLRALFGARHQE